MKIFLLALAAISMSIMISGCGSNASDSPKEAYLEYAKLLKNSEYDKVCDSMSEKYRKEFIKDAEDLAEDDEKVESCEQAYGDIMALVVVFYGKDALKDANIQVTKVEEDGDEATVHTKTRFKGEDEWETGEVTMVREDGRWLLDDDNDSEDADESDSSDSDDSDSDSSDSDDSDDQGENEKGTRSNPIKYQDSVEIDAVIDGDNDEYDAKIRLSVIDAVSGDEAFSKLEQMNEFNEPAPEGYEWVLAQIGVELLDAETQNEPFTIDGFFDFDMVSTKGDVYSGDDDGSGSTDPDVDFEMYAGDTDQKTGYIAGLVKEGDGAQLIYENDFEETFFDLQ